MFSRWCYPIKLGKFEKIQFCSQDTRDATGEQLSSVEVVERAWWPCLSKYCGQSYTSCMSPRRYPPVWTCRWQTSGHPQVPSAIIMSGLFDHAPLSLMSPRRVFLSPWPLLLGSIPTPHLDHLDQGLYEPFVMVLQSIFILNTICLFHTSNV